MTDYMVKFKELTNAVSVDIDSYKGGYGEEKRAKLAAERFLSAANLIPDNEYLGWEIEVKNINRISMIAFSSRNVEITESDFRWILKANALSLRGSFAPWEKSFWEGRFVYALSVRDEVLGQKITEGTDRHDEARFGSKCEKEITPEPDFRILLDIMKDFDNAYFRILAGNDTNGEKRGVIMVSLPKEMPLRMKTELSIVLPSMIVKRVKDDDTGSGIEMLPSEPIGVAFMYMLKAVIAADSTIYNSCCNNFLDELDLDDEDLLLDEELEEVEDIEETPKSSSLTDTTPLEDLELSVRAYNCLRRAGVTTVGQLRSMSDEELMKVRNLGRKSMEEVKSVLQSIPVLAKEAPGVATNYMDALDELIGLVPVKEQVRKIAAFARMKQDMQELGKAEIPIVFNMEFSGNPGTAKTTVARILAGIFHEVGLLATSEMVEVGRADLIARYEGQTADKVRHVFESALGKVLFIDEAYSLVENWEGAYGDEAIDTIVQEMENHRDETVVVFAGYPKEMDEFFSRNPGLRSRVPFKITFSDYSADEMELISEMEAKKRGFSIHDAAKDKVTEICRDAKDDVNAGNGRFCRNLIENAILGYASRVYGGEETAADKDCVLIEADFSDSAQGEKKKASIPIGFRVA